MVDLNLYRYQGIAGRSNTERMNIEHRTSNIECRMGFDIGFLKKKKLNCGTKWHHYSMFNVRCSILDVQLPVVSG